jgi:hypothetical protein
MVALFRRGCEILAAGDDERWEEEGGRRREFLDLASSLHRRLGLRPWQHDVFEVDVEPLDDDQVDDWSGARAARRALLEAIGEST